MAENKEVFVFIGTYDNLKDAQLDYAAVKELHRQGVIGTYDAAVVDKDAQGEVHVHKDEKPTQHGAWTGIVAGAVVGVLFPPSILAGAAIGGVAGGIIGHVYHGMSRQDMKDLGETLDKGRAALVIIGKTKLSDQIEHATTHAQKKVEKQLDIDTKNFEKEIASASAAAT